jgi:hypothetical protein
MQHANSYYKGIFILSRATRDNMSISLYYFWSYTHKESDIYSAC